MLAVLGFALLVLLLLDALWTTMGVGGGKLTRRLTNVVYRGVLALYHRFPSRILLIWGGIAVLLSAFVVWVALLWAGWTLIFSASEGAVVHGTTGVPADLAAQIYFTGFTIFTLGTGDYVAVGGVWQVLMAVASLSGLFLVTFSITYLLPVVQSATQKRRLASVISSLGLSGSSILLHAMDDEGSADLSDYLTTLAMPLAQIEQQHLTYPILHYLHGSRRSEALSLSVAALDEALTILDCGLQHRSGISASHFRAIRQVITQFLFTLQHAFIDPADEPPPAPSLEPFRQKGLDVVTDEEFARCLEGLAHRRRLLASLVTHEGWSWDFAQVDAIDAAPTTALSRIWVPDDAS